MKTGSRIRVGIFCLLIGTALVALASVGVTRNAHAQDKGPGLDFKLDTFLGWEHSDKIVRIEDLKLTAKENSIFGWKFQATMNIKNKTEKKLLLAVCFAFLDENGALVTSGNYQTISLIGFKPREAEEVNAEFPATPEDVARIKKFLVVYKFIKLEEPTK